MKLSGSTNGSNEFLSPSRISKTGITNCFYPFLGRHDSLRNDAKHNDTQHSSVFVLSGSVLAVHAECNCAESDYARCHYVGDMSGLC
jgi:hypothetical protein